MDALYAIKPAEDADPGGRMVIGVCLWPLACWDCEFEQPMA